MSFFRSYFQPGKAAVSQTAKEKQPLDNVGDPAPASSNRSIASSSGDDRYSRRSTYYPAGDFRNQTSDEIIDIKCDVMVNYLHQQQLESMWSTGGPGEGVVLKKLKDRFTCCPDDLSLYRGELFDAVSALNVKASQRTLQSEGLGSYEDRLP